MNENNKKKYLFLRKDKYNIYLFSPNIKINLYLRKIIIFPNVAITRICLPINECKKLLYVKYTWFFHGSINRIHTTNMPRNRKIQFRYYGSAARSMCERSFRDAENSRGALGIRCGLPEVRRESPSVPLTRVCTQRTLRGGKTRPVPGAASVLSAKVASQSRCWNTRALHTVPVSSHTR